MLNKGTAIIIIVIIVIGVAGYLALNKTQEPQAELLQTEQFQTEIFSENTTGQCTPTGHDVQGPFYLPNAPFRANLAPPDASGDKLIVKGRVLDMDCQPLADAIVDIWHTDANGDYDFSENYWYRGMVKTGIDGKFEFHTYKFETVRPGRYPQGSSFRPAHIHMKVSFPGHKLLTTQLYFSDDPYLFPNDPCTGCRSDDPSHIIDLKSSFSKEGYKTWEGIFDIVLEPGEVVIEEIPSYR